MFFLLLVTTLGVALLTSALIAFAITRRAESKWGEGGAR